MFKYSYDALVYAGEPIEKSIKRVAKYGYDAIELVGEPSQHDTAEVRRLCNAEGIVVSSICSIFFGAERDLVAVDKTMRAKGVGYAKSVVDFGHAVGAPIVNLAPSPVGKTSPATDPKEEWKFAVDSIGEIADYAAKANMLVCLEPWNRYETYFINRLHQALDLANAVGRKNLGVMGDTFHMNIEDGSIEAAPGRGHIDFKPIVKALVDINYDGYIAFELLPAAADPFATLRSGGGTEFLDEYTRLAINTIRQVEAEVRQ
jgi:sugar phosphate isomerase/epimerase